MSLTSINTSGTELGVDFGTGSNIVNITLGNPSSIVLKNPTSSQLIPDRVSVGSYCNLTSLDLRNVPNTKTYAVFDKIFKTYVYGGTINWGYELVSRASNAGVPAYTYTGAQDRFVTSPVEVNPSSAITATAESGMYLYEIDENYNYLTYWTMNGSARSISFDSPNVKYVIIGNSGGSSITQSIKIVDNSSGNILFEYRT